MRGSHGVAQTMNHSTTVYRSLLPSFVAYVLLIPEIVIDDSIYERDQIAHGEGRKSLWRMSLNEPYILNSAKREKSSFPKEFWCFFSEKRGLPGLCIRVMHTAIWCVPTSDTNNLLPLQEYSAIALRVWLPNAMLQLLHGLSPLFSSVKDGNLGQDKIVKPCMAVAARHSPNVTTGRK
ncbi:uncharacterized protein LOC119331738 [Triticum dicoccoides]|uniref:uncharacterized protein LOC119331738 n=1 Tax=Triticum dicoccoides TaxID=85692 RepID=UPI001891C338|nr:uncharacterized protein LOC119331738 [Triticum dicoccoides]